MADARDHPIVQRHDLHDRLGAFADRADAGRVLGEMLSDLAATAATVLAVPAGGVPVAVEVARKRGWPLDVAVVSKITPPGSTEIGYGAVAFDGTVRLNDSLLARMSLSPEAIEEGIRLTREKVRRRVELFRAGRPMPDLSGRMAVLVDDGLASGFTMRVAIEAVAGLGAAAVVVAVPTAHDQAARLIAGQTDAVYCANLRAGYAFAVADAYRHWTDVTEAQALSALEALRRERTA